MTSPMSDRFAFIVVVAVLLLAAACAALEGPDEVESAQASADSHTDAIKAAQVAKGE